jgi:hypothetical protein
MNFCNKTKDKIENFCNKTKDKINSPSPQLRQ